MVPHTMESLPVQFCYSHWMFPNGRTAISSVAGRTGNIFAFTPASTVRCRLRTGIGSEVVCWWPDPPCWRMTVCIWAGLTSMESWMTRTTVKLKRRLFEMFLLLWPPMQPLLVECRPKKKSPFGARCERIHENDNTIRCVIHRKTTRGRVNATLIYEYLTLNLSMLCWADEFLWRMKQQSRYWLVVISMFHNPSKYFGC